MYDMKNLKKLKSLDAGAPEAMKAFWAFDKAAMAGGAIPAKYKELMAVAVALTTQCPYCIQIHSDKRFQKSWQLPQPCGPVRPSRMAPTPSRSRNPTSIPRSTT
jgi:alkylhydroperoxidase family enzyme